MVDNVLKGQAAAAWWEQWWKEDYSWDGLSSKPLNGWIVSADGYLVDAQSGRIYGQPECEEPISVRGRSATLQDYWRADTNTGKILSDCQLGTQLVSLKGQPVFHWVHLPLLYQDGTATEKSYIVNRKVGALDIFISPRIRIASDAIALFPRHERAQPNCVWQANLQGAILLAGFDLPDLGKPPVLYINLRHAAFAGEVDFRKLTFFGKADLRFCNFLLFADLSGAVFEGEADFEAAIFGGDVRFNGASFRKSSRFQAANFFDGADFRRSIFEASADFSLATFAYGARFEHSRYYCAATFAGARFQNGASFDSFQCRGRLDFSSVGFAGSSSFSGAVFWDDVLFESAVFRGRANFADAFFNGATSFDGALFVGDLTLRNNSFRRSLTFRDARIKTRGSISAYCCLAPDITGARIHPGFRFDGVVVYGLGRLSLLTHSISVLAIALIITGIFQGLQDWYGFGPQSVALIVAGSLLLFGWGLFGAALLSALLK